MLKQKIEYGIDLGTTNSAISRFEKGRVRIIKSERLQKDTTPSCVHYTKRGQLLVGDAAFSRLSSDPENTKTEFKRTMGTEVSYHFPSIQKSLSSEELSAEVLKNLKASVKDDEFSSVVITVPADFDQVQIEATQRAAELAGFDYCELLQEPIAASLAYLLEEENVGGHWLVFDMGGGTFDVALMNADNGIVRVVDTAGDNYLGGKNMDLLIVDEIIIPKLKAEFKIDGLLKDQVRKRRLQSIWKKYAEQYKIQLSTDAKVLIESDDPSVMQDDDGNDLDVCVDFHREQFEGLIKPLVDESIELTHKLLKRNQLGASEIRTILLIGGPTYIPYVRQRVQAEINESINVNIDPMTAVTVGAALYASTKTVPITNKTRDASKAQLLLDVPLTTVEKSVTLSIRFDRDRTQGVMPERIFVEVSRSDQAWSSGRMEMRDNAIALPLHLAANTTNGFSVELFDQTGNKIQCQPNGISVLQGFELSNPPLPHDICVEADHERLGHVIVPLLMKGQTLPAVGKKSFATRAMLRPNTHEDIFSIIVREGEMNTRPVRNVMVGKITITGAELTRAVPKGSPVEITLRMDESRRINVTAYFPDSDETIQNVLETSFRAGLIDQDQLDQELESELRRTAKLDETSSQAGDAYKQELADLGQLITAVRALNTERQGDSDSGFTIRNRLNELQIRLDDIEHKLEWRTAEYDLNETYKHAKKIVEIFGNSSHKKSLAEASAKMDQALQSREFEQVAAVTRLFSDIRQGLLMEQPGFWISILNNISATYNSIHWTDAAKARELVDKGRGLLDQGESLEDIKQVVRSLWGLMTVEEKRRTQKARPDIPFYKI